MNEQINQILQELYKYDPEFMKHEKELKEILGQMLQSAPNTKFDPLFAESLRKKILIRAEEISSESGLVKDRPMWQFALPAFAVMAIAVLVGANYWKNLNNTQIASIKESKLQPLAFGSLSGIVPGGFGRGGGGGMGGGDGSAQNTAVITDEAMKARPQSGGGGDMPILPVFENYKFVYAGENLDLKEENLPVFRRVKGFGKTLNLSSIIKNFSVPVFNLKNLQNPYVEMLTLTEDRDFGYMVNLNFKEGSLNINENWFKWQTPDRMCQDEACYNRYRLKISDLPSDEEVISIADNFLEQYGVNKNIYAEPVVQKQWFRDYQAASDKSMAWVPDVLTIVYPYQIQGQTVYDQSGSQSGLMVSVNARVKKVSGLYELTNQVYESSDYSAETSFDRIKKIAEAGGNQVFYPAYEPNIPSVQVKLGTPSRSLMRMWKNEAGKEGYEIFVPALVFPIIDPPANFPSYRSAVTIPLIKELITEPSVIDPGQPMPLTAPKG